MTGHAMWPDMPERNEDTAFLIDFHLNGFRKLKENWEKIKKITEEANSQDFVTFHSYEMHSCAYGDHHLVSPDKDIELLYAGSPKELLEKLKQRAIMVPHHIAYTPGYRGIDWDAYTEDISPIVEIYSKHGLALNADAPFPYYHNMGPRDDRNTVYEGLKKGKRFGFAASTDHHAGYPGSYGDGKIAVLAETLDRESIWQAIHERRCYAVTGDKIRCEFSGNDRPMGSILPADTRKIDLRYKVEADYAIDKVILYKNLRPVQITNGEFLGEDTEHAGTYKLRFEFGWGNNTDALYKWDCTAEVKNAKILHHQSCFRGRNVLAPHTLDTAAYDDVNAIDNKVLGKNDHEIRWQCFTTANITTLHPATQQMILEVEGDEKSELLLTVNGRRHHFTLRDLMKQGCTYQVKKYTSQAYKIYKALPESSYLVTRETEDNCSSGDFYHLEVYQKNGSCAFVSPVFID